MPVVLNAQMDDSVSLFQTNIHCICVSVPGDIREGFLADAKDGRRLFGLKFQIFMADDTAARNAGPSLKIPALPFNRRDKAEIVKHSGSQLSHDALDGCDGRIDLFLHRTNAFLRSTSLSRAQFVGQESAKP